MPYRDERQALLQRQNVLAEQLAGVRTRLVALTRPKRLIAQTPHKHRGRGHWGALLLAVCTLSLVATPALAFAGLLGARALTGRRAKSSELVRPFVDAAPPNGPLQLADEPEIVPREYVEVR